MASGFLQLDDRMYDYISKSINDSDLKKRLRDETARLPAGRMQISPHQGQFMEFLIKAIGARNTIEIGVFTGYSTLCTALALPDDGHILACDISDEWTSIGRRYWEEAGVADKIDLRLGSAVDTLDQLIAQEVSNFFDFAFIDADKNNYPDYYRRLKKLIRKGGVIAIDNTLWGGRVVDSSVNDPDTLAIREIGQIVASDPDVQMSHLPIGDGLILAVKNK